MTVLLTIVGLAVGFLLGAWAVRRGSRQDGRTPSPAPSAPADTEYALVEDHRDGVVVADRLGEVVYRNRAARDRRGTHVGVLVDEAIDRQIKVTLEHGSSADVLDLFGPPRAVLTLRARWLDRSRIVVFVEDVTERRLIDQVRTDFVANISHELKTPVGALSVLAETLESETDPETVARLVDRMMSEAQRASRTIDDLIELSRIEAGAGYEFESIEVESVVNDTLERVAELASQREISVSDLTPAGRLDGVVIVGDRRQLVSALGNLVENAIKYSELGAQVQICTRVGQARVEFSVTDHGVGIPQRDLDRIFERFYRVDHARSRATGGTGLGLSIVRHVADNHGGEVAVLSNEGEGSVFTFALPAQLDDPSDVDETGERRLDHSDWGSA